MEDRQIWVYDIEQFKNFNLMDITKLETTSKTGVIKPTHIYSATINDWLKLSDNLDWSDGIIQDDIINNIVILNSHIAFIQFKSDISNIGYLYKGFFECT